MNHKKLINYGLFGLILVVIFFLTLTVLIRFLPALPVRSTPTELAAEGNPYVVPFKNSFGKFENALPPDDGEKFDTDQSAVDYDYKFYPASGDITTMRHIGRLKADGREIFNVLYNVEKNSRRVGRNRDNLNADLGVVFVGCSFTFGDGVEFGDTFTAQFQEKYPKIAFYNAGIRGSGLNEHLQLLQDKKHFLNQKLNKKIILIYTYMGDHIFRESCSSRCLQNDYNWVLLKPRYEISGEQLVQVGDHSTRYFTNKFLSYLFSSDLLKNVDFPEILSPLNIKRHQEILKAFYSELSKTQQVIGAYHFWGLSTSNDEINRELASIKQTPYRPVILQVNEQLKQGLKPYYIRNNMHPNRLGHSVAFESLNWVLSRDYPEYFKNR